MNIGERLFSPVPIGRETPEQAAKRAEENAALCRSVFGTVEGGKLLRLLYSVSHPLAPRFAPGRSAEEAAFLDGERHLIGLLWLNGRSDRTMNPDEPAP